MCKQDKIRSEIQASINAKRAVLNNPETISIIQQMSDGITASLKNGGKLLICGNGGSASDAMHMVGEIVGRFQKERKAYAAIALNADVATLTAIANDYGYAQIFARQVEGLMTEKDILLGISTSGNSENVIKAVEKAHEMGGKAYLFSGMTGGKLGEMCDLSLIVPSDITAHIQEVHECVFHIICGLVENDMVEA